MPRPAPSLVRHGAFESSARSAMRLDEADGVLHRHNLLGRVVGNFATEFFLESHDQLDRVEAVRPQIVDEAGIFGHLGFVDAEMLDNNLLNPLGDVAHAMISSIAAADWLCLARSRRPIRGSCRLMSAAANRERSAHIS